MAQFVIEDSGFSMFKLAKLFSVPRSIIYRWMEKHKEFSDAVEIGRTTYEGIKIHTSLVKRAVGFSYNETTKEPSGENGDLKTSRVVRKYFAPDVAAIKHWQVNRDPNKWGDKSQIDINQKVEGCTIQFVTPDGKQITGPEADKE